MVCCVKNSAFRFLSLLPIVSIGARPLKNPFDLKIESYRGDESRGRYVQYFYYFSTLLLTFYLVKNYLIYGVTISTWACTLLTLALFSLPFFRVPQKYGEVRSFLSIFLPCASLIVLVFDAGGMNAPGPFWLIAIPVTFVISHELRGLIFGLGLMIFAIVSYSLLEKFGIRGEVEFSPATFSGERMVNFTSFCIYITYTTFYHLRSEKKAKDLLRASNQEVENLFRVLIHDISTPISVCSLAGTQLANPNLTEKSKEKAISRLLNAIEHTEKILGKIRAFKAIRDGKSKIQISLINPQKCTESIVHLLQNRAEEKNVQINLTGSSKDLFISGDEVILGDFIIGNFISNAIKFSPPGSTVDVQIVPDQNRLTIYIRDHGIGIPVDILNNIWRFDVTTSRLGTKGEKGTGYGMPIAKELMEKIGGQVSIESQTGENSGTIVKLSFPVQKAA